MVRCESVQASSAIAFLNQCRQLSEADEVSEIVQQIAIYGPLTAPMERRAGRYRYQLMLQGSDRRPLHRFLNWWVPQLGNLSGARKVRWSIDIDPYDTY
jgi:primosomal protein N' (replication factor Y)